jgi:hypothetical protein
MEEDEARAVETEITYLLPGSFINRRFVAAGQEYNTGHYAPYSVLVRDARLMADHFTLDTHGFQLFRHRSAVKDFFDKDHVNEVYPYEVVDAVMAFTGATRVAPLGWMVRTSGGIPKRKVVGYEHRGGVQPPAGEAHVDTAPDRVDAYARSVYERTFPGGKGYSRFICSSFWRTFSEPPQDTPLAVCDAKSVRVDEGVTNTLHIVDEIPGPEDALADKWNDQTLIAAAIFHFNPAHRWWYFSNMTRDEALLIKFHDSDKGKPWRTPHTAFRDPSFADAKPRSSVEFRTIAYFE